MKNGAQVCGAIKTFSLQLNFIAPIFYIFSIIFQRNRNRCKPNIKRKITAAEIYRTAVTIKIVEIYTTEA